MIYQVALSLIKHLPVRLLLEIKKKCKSHEMMYDTLKNIVNSSNTKTAEKIRAQISSDKILIDAKNILNDCNKFGIQIVDEESNLYPKLLKECPDRPIIIYLKGSLNPNELDLISIIGTRNCSNYGIKNCEKLVEEFARYNVGLVSGLAYGIDVKVHKYANQLNIPNYAVLGSGINNIYPRSHTGYADEITKNGMLISEFPPFTKPFKYNFPKRNRIIAGMTKCTIVVESPIKGGAIITAKLANDYNRDVFAMPGDIDKVNSQGCNELISNNQAHLATSSEKIINTISLNKKNKIATIEKKIGPNLSIEEKEIYDYINYKKGATFNMIQSQLNIPIPKLNAILTKMEIDEVISQLPGKIYK